MPRRFTDYAHIRQALLDRMKNDGQYSPKTILHMEWDTRLAERFLGGMSLYDLSADDLKKIARNMAKSGLAVATQKDYIFALKQMLKLIGNPAWQAHIQFQADTRPHVDWLSPEDARKVLDSEVITPTQHLVIVLALCMGLRKVEIARLRIRDICPTGQYITVIGKGRAGGKLRLVPYHKRFNGALLSYLGYRAEIVTRARNGGPEELLVWYDRHTHTVSPYESVKGSGLDYLIRNASKAIGVKFSAHTLRRTFGRLLWLSGVPVVTIAKILGHSSTEQTLEYIGANLDDMTDAMQQLSLQ